MLVVDVILTPHPKKLIYNIVINNIITDLLNNNLKFNTAKLKRMCSSELSRQNYSLNFIFYMKAFKGVQIDIFL